LGCERRNFGLRRVAPRVTIVDRKPYVRTFLAETFEELGFIAECCSEASELFPSLNTVEPDLVVVVVSEDEEAARDVLKVLAASLFRGRIMLIGSRSAPAITCAQDHGEHLGLTMLPLLPTPFRTAELKQRVAPLLPTEPPPPLPVDFVEALGSNWLELWYHPKIDPRALRPLGVEALIRLRHPSWGIVPPAHFLPQQGDPHFRALSDFVVMKAMADWSYFASYAAPIELSINLPGAVLTDPHFVERMQRQLPSHPAFRRLLVEIDSSELAHDFTQIQEIVRALCGHGIGISIDNLGAECSSLLGLEGCPIAELKVARAVVQGCAENRLKRALCATILDTGRRLGARTVAEGVETRADLAAVREIGFDLVQGFLFGKPMIARKFARMLRLPPNVPT
jgi:EAL domain-containing protein (putative c-di-GMP-specific phosphodiesterase class I)/CheY-like chemotaxis protein